MTTQNPVLVTVSYGGGINSTALLARLVEQNARVDLILFADTGGERPETYEYVSMFSAWLKQRGYPGITVVRYANRHGQAVSLEADCLRKHTLPSKAFGRPGCSLKWKAEPQEKFLNNYAPAKAVWDAGGRVVKILGFDADEPHRVLRRVHEDAADTKYAYVYPLYAWGWGREECEEHIERAGLPSPGKSSCFFCPSMKKKEILHLADAHPDLLVRALDMEAAAMDTPVGERVSPPVESSKGLGRSFRWSEFLKGTMCDFSGAEDTPCGCYDG